MTIDEMPPYCYSNYRHNRGPVASTNQGQFRILCLEAKFPFVSLSKILTGFLAALVEKEQEPSDLSALHSSIPPKSSKPLDILWIHYGLTQYS